MNFDLDSVVGLVDTLYQPQQLSETINSAQREIQSLQREIWAPQLAHALLNTNKQTSQFIGAVTYTVYITNHTNAVDINFASQIISEIVQIVQKQLDKVVLQKMLANLSKLVPILKVNLIQELFTELQKLNLDGLQLVQLGLLTFGNLSDELSRGESGSLNVHQLVHDEIWPIGESILNSEDGFRNFKSLWFETVSSCISYISKAEFETALTFNLNPYISICIDALRYTNDFEALDILLEIYETNQTLINNENKLKLDQLIFSDWCWQSINANEYDDNEKLARLVSLYMESDIISLATKLVKPEFSYKFDMLLNMTMQEGKLPIIEEPFSKELLNFWVVFAEAFDYDYENITQLIKNPQKIEDLKVKSKDHFLKLSNIYWRKCHLLPIEELVESEDLFRVFRRDVGELFEGMVTIVKSDLFNSLTNSIIINLSNVSENIIHIESSLYLLNSISSVFTENNVQPENIQAISELFHSPYFATLTNLLDQYTCNETDQSLTPYLARTSISFISEISWFYKSPENSQYLPTALDFLFKCLQAPVKSNGFNFQESSSKAILKISNECRSQLLSLISIFEMSSNSILQNEKINPAVKSRIIRSYAAILESMDDLTTKSVTISRILDIVEVESTKVLSRLSQNTDAPGTQLELLTDHLVSLLSSLVGLAKGLQLPTDWEEYFSTTSNDDEDGELDLLKLEQISAFWLSDPYGIHEKSIRIISVYLDILKTKSNLADLVMSEIILFFKAGLSESIPGPFVLPYEVILEFIIKCFNGSNIHQLTNLMDIYSHVVKSVSIERSRSSQLINILNSTKLNMNIDPNVDLHIREMINLLVFNPINEISQDPDLLQGTFNMISSILLAIPSSVIPSTENGLPLESFKQIISLALHETFKSNERFVIKSNCDFWVALSHNKKFTKLEKDFVIEFFDSSIDLTLISNDLLQLINGNGQQVQSYGQILLQVLIFGMLKTARSNVDFFAEVLRIYVGDHPLRIKSWLEFTISRLINNKLIEADKGSIFVKKLVVSRGQRIALKLIKEFWRDSTGSIDFNI